MDIDKDELRQKFQQQDWNYVFDKARIISEFLLIQKFRIYDEPRRQDMVQECLENFYKKILKGKVDPNNNIFAFIWKNSTNRILEMLRKERNRNRIATFSPYDDLDENNYSSYIDFDAEVGDKYAVAVGE